MASKESMELRGVIARNQRWDLIVGTVGLLATALGVIILTLLFLDLVLDGWRRLTPEFFLNFPSRRPEEAGILSAWVGSALVMIVTAFTAVPLGAPWAARTSTSPMTAKGVTGASGPGGVARIGHALAMISGPTPAGSPIVTMSGRPLITA